ncbi:MAG: efflux RND transporter periplasmic adaptor subunit [Desulfocapsaceae bacterium]|nr:efflux RND transporter periplasmic adaptor subunit [Desulfocapsaceae bacterium]
MKRRNILKITCCTILAAFLSLCRLEPFADQASAATELADAPTIEIPAEKQQLIGVKIIALSQQPMETVIRTVGRVDYDERGLATINTRFEGWIEKLFVNVTGSVVKKGQPLAEIYSPELYATQLEFINALRMAGNEKTTTGTADTLQTMLAKDSQYIVEAAKQRLLLWDISESQIKTIAKTGKPIRTLSIESPVNGAVIQKNVVLGMRVMPGDKMFDIADLSTVWVVADLYESQMAQVGIGQKVSISFDNFPGKVIASTIDFVAPVLTGETRTVRVRCTIPNADGQLKPQMFATMEIRIDLGEKLAVPDDAVIDTGTRKIVYVDRGEGLFEPREVLTGIKSGGLTELTQGVKVGEKVAIAANFLIDSEAQLKGITPLHSP